MADNFTENSLIEKTDELKYTQELRKKVINSITDKAIANEDVKLLNSALMAMDSMDKNSFGILKLNEKKKENETKANESEALSKYLIALSNERVRKEDVKGYNENVEKQLPAILNKKIDESILESYSNIENTNDFVSRLESNQSN